MYGSPVSVSHLIVTNDGLEPADAGADSNGGDKSEEPGSDEEERPQKKSKGG